MTGMSYSKDAAKAMGVSLKSVYCAIASRELEETSLRFGCGHIKTTPAVAEAAKPIFSDADLAPACFTYLALNPTAKDVDELASAVRKAKSLADRVALIEEATKSRRADMKTTGGAKKPIKAALARSGKTIENMLNSGDSLCYLQMTMEEAQNFLTLLTKSAQKLADILAGPKQGT